MPVITDSQGTTFRPITYDKEVDFERVVVTLADHIFGPATIYVDVKKKIAGHEVVSIPDGYVLDMTEPDNPKLFIVENEVAKHDPFRHIGIQLLRFATSFDGAQSDIRNFLMEEIAKNKTHLGRLEEACRASSKRNIDNYLDAAVFGPFRALVVIDEARSELHHVLEKINANISVIEVKSFQDEDGKIIHLLDTLYDEYDDDAAPHLKPSKLRDRLAARRARRARSDTIVVPAKQDGFQSVFIGENRWYAIRIGAAMKDRINYIAAYQAAPLSAVTHIAEVQDIRLYQDSGKYVVTFRGPALEITPVPIKHTKNSPQGPVYVQRADLLKAKHLEDALM